MGRIVKIQWFFDDHLHLVTFEMGDELLMTGAQIVNRANWKELHK